LKSSITDAKGNDASFGDTIKGLLTSKDLEGAKNSWNTLVSTIQQAQNMAASLITLIMEDTEVARTYFSVVMKLPVDAMPCHPADLMSVFQAFLYLDCGSELDYGALGVVNPLKSVTLAKASTPAKLITTEKSSTKRNDKKSKRSEFN
jgi:hypothetical protein